MDDIREEIDNGFHAHFSLKVTVLPNVRGTSQTPRFISPFVLLLSASAGIALFIVLSTLSCVKGCPLVVSADPSRLWKEREQIWPRLITKYDQII